MYPFLCVFNEFSLFYDDYLQDQILLRYNGIYYILYVCLCVFGHTIIHSVSGVEGSIRFKIFSLL